MGGSHWTLLEIMREARSIRELEKRDPPIACPYDGTPLQFHPVKAVLFCPNGDYQVRGRPRDP